MLTITENTTPYWLPTANEVNSARVLGVLQTYFCITRCEPVDPNGYVVEISVSGTDYLIRYYNVETNVDDDDSLSLALFTWNSGTGQQQPFPTFRGVRAYMTASQTFSDNTPALIEFDDESYDTDSFITPTDDTFTIPIDMAGYYNLILNVIAFVTGGAGVYFVVLEILVDGVIEETFFTATRNLQAGYVNASVIINIPAEAEVQIQIEFQGTGASDRELSSGSVILQHVGI